MQSYTLHGAYHYNYETSNHNGYYDATGVLIPESLDACPIAPVYYNTPPVSHGQTYGICPPLELHAPIPLPGQSPPLLDYTALRSIGAIEPYQSKAFNILFPFPGQQQDVDSTPADSLALCQPPVDLPINPEYCGGDATLQNTFPTPSELLAELAEKGMPMIGDELGSDARSESASKARRRAMSKRVGFIPIDPDTISSHEKKRHYLESLEQYILYLHEQFSLIHQEHAPLERVANYKGLSSRSIRTVLVHMENTTRDLNIRTLAEEERFVNLRDEVLRSTG